MSFFKNTLSSFVILLAMIIGGPALSDGDLPVVTGEVKRVKPDSGKITISTTRYPTWICRA